MSVKDLLQKLKTFFSESTDKWYFMPLVGFPVILIILGSVLLSNKVMSDAKAPEQAETSEESDLSLAGEEKESKNERKTVLGEADEATEEANLVKKPTTKPTAKPTSTNKPVPTSEPEPTQEPTNTPSPTSEPTNAPEPTNTPNPTQTPSPTATTAPTNTPTASPTPVNEIVSP